VLAVWECQDISKSGVAGELRFQPLYIQLYICGLRLYISCYNQDNQLYFNRLSVINRILRNNKIINNPVFPGKNYIFINYLEI
jgi:hypothetical protein